MLKTSWGRRSVACLWLVGLLAVAGGWSAQAQAAPVGVPVPGVQGTVVAWGSNQQGQATVPAGTVDVVAVAASESGSTLLHADGTVSTFGYQTAPVPTGLTGVTAIAGGAYFNLALKSDGTVVAWGTGPGVTDLPAGLVGVTAIAAGGDHGVALLADRTVVSWGEIDIYGQPFTAPSGLGGVTAITTGYDVAYALKDDGTVVSWPSAGSAPAGLSNVVAISSGLLHTLALKSDGSIVGWGQNHDGAIDIPAGLTGVVAIAAGGGSSYAVRADGTVAAWGWNQDGKTTVPTGLTDVTSIAAGYGQVLAVVAPPATLTASSPPTTAAVGAPDAYTFTATGRPAPRFTVSNGVLPAGLSLDAATGALAGTPTTPGTSTFTVTAGNGRGAGAPSASITVTVAGAPAPPVGSGPTTVAFIPPGAPPTGDGALAVTDPRGAATSSAVPGGRTTFTARGYAPGTTVTFVAYSSPVVLGTAVVDASGTAILTTTLPAELAAGMHTVVSYGTAADGTSRVLTATVTVTDGQVLANTGADVGLLLPAGVLMIAGGAVALVGVRRRA